MGYRNKVVNLAQRQVGYKESGKNQTKYARWFDNEAWQWFNTKKQGAEWCAIFVCWLIAQNEILGAKKALEFLGCPAPKNNCAAGVPFLYEYLTAKGYKLVDKTKGQLGDIIVLYSKKHVGIIETVSNGKYITIEGNKNNQVGRGSYKLSSSTISAVFHLPYEKLDKAETDPVEQLPDKPAPVTPAAPAKIIYQVNTKHDPLMLRCGAGTNFPIICRLPKGATVTYKGTTTGKWLKVQYKTMIGWAHGDCLKKV